MSKMSRLFWWLNDEAGLAWIGYALVLLLLFGVPAADWLGLIDVF